MSNRIIAVATVLERSSCWSRRNQLDDFVALVQLPGACIHLLLHHECRGLSLTMLVAGSSLFAAEQALVSRCILTVE